MILYFSATGNSEYVAKKIAAETGDVTVSITDCYKNKFSRLMRNINHLV